MFQGYTNEAIEFLMALKFNNNREFFLANRDVYERTLRAPTLALAQLLQPAVQAIDPLLETRPQKVVSRINRDIRFSKDKSPYRDHIWIGYRRPSVVKGTTLGVYVYLDTDSAGYGMGYYAENRPVMNALRRQILTAPEHVSELTNAALKQFQLVPTFRKRPQTPDDVPENLRTWYALKCFYIEKPITDTALLFSPALADEVVRGFGELKPFYRFLTELVPESDDYGGTNERTKHENRSTMKEGYDA